MRFDPMVQVPGGPGQGWRRDPDRQPLLQADLVDSVFRLAVREPVTVTGGELLNKAAAAEPATQAHVALRCLHSLLIPVWVKVVDGEVGLRTREPVTIA